MKNRINDKSKHSARTKAKSAPATKALSGQQLEKIREAISPDKSVPEKVAYLIHLPPEEAKGIAEMAKYLDAKPEQVIEALLMGQAEDHLGRKNDDIWEHIVEYLAENYGPTSRLALVARYLAVCDVNGQLPSTAERRVLYDEVLASADHYERYLRRLAKTTALPTAFDRCVRNALAGDLHIKQSRSPIDRYSLEIVGWRGGDGENLQSIPATPELLQRLKGES